MRYPRSWTSLWWYWQRLIRFSRLVRPPLIQCWMWCRSTRRDSQPGYRQRQVSRSRAARRSAADGRRRRRPRSRMVPSWSCSIQLSAAVQAIICAVLTLIAGPSSTWHRAGSAGSPGTGRAAAGVSAETPAGSLAAGVTAGSFWARAPVPTWTMTWYISGSSAAVILSARNDSRSPAAHRPGSTMSARPAGPGRGVPAGTPPPAAVRSRAGGPGRRRPRAAPAAAPRLAAAAAGTCPPGTRRPRTARPAAAGPGPRRHRRG